MDECINRRELLDYLHELEMMYKEPRVLETIREIKAEIILGRFRIK